MKVTQKAITRSLRTNISRYAIKAGNVMIITLRGIRQGERMDEGEEE